MKQSLLILVFSFISILSFSQVPESKDSAKSVNEVQELKSLTKMAESDKYGLTPEYPVKVGKTGNSGPLNQRMYLELLRDAQGNKLKYERVGSCCAYKSENGFMGYAMVDRYEVKYKDKDGNAKKTIIYISFYDFEEPLIPVGFQGSVQD
jgi:hypothetical protein